MFIDEDTKTCRCPDTHYYRQDEAEEFGHCVEIPPCGKNNHFISDHYLNKCVPARDTSECAKGEVYDRPRDVCRFENDCG